MYAADALVVAEKSAAMLWEPGAGSQISARDSPLVGEKYREITETRTCNDGGVEKNIFTR